MQDDEQYSPEESEERNQQLFSDLCKIYHVDNNKEIVQHVKFVRERLLQNRNDAMHQQNGTFKQTVVLDRQQGESNTIRSSYVTSASLRERNQYHYLSTIAALILVSALVGSFVLVFIHFHASKSEGPVINARPTNTPVASTIRAKWKLTNSMHIARGNQSATLLSNGKVLVVGGGADYHYANGFVSTELYDPETGKWSSTGNLHIGRSSQTATLLKNGEVLVTGGFTNTFDVTATAELYNPSTGKWSLTASMHNARAFHTATLLPNGKVLVVGGYTNGYPTIAPAELYDPTIGQWSLTGNMHVLRQGHTATLLSNGKVLAVGGWDMTAHALASAELYDPSTNTWSLTSSMHEAHGDLIAIALTDGKVLVTGGYNDMQKSLPSAEIYDPGTGKWELTGSMKIARIRCTATLLPDGKVLVTGGENDPTSLASLASSELYDPVTGIWSFTASIHFAREGHTATLLPNGTVLITGGLGYSNALASAELFTFSHV